MAKIIVQNIEVNVTKVNNEDYICLTDMIKAKDGNVEYSADSLRGHSLKQYDRLWPSLGRYWESPTYLTKVHVKELSA